MKGKGAITKGQKFAPLPAPPGFLSNHDIVIEATPLSIHAPTGKDFQPMPAGVPAACDEESTIVQDLAAHAPTDFHSAPETTAGQIL